MNCFVLCSAHMPNDIGGIYAVITRNTITAVDESIQRAKSYLCFAKYLGDCKWQSYTDNELDITELDNFYEETILPDEYEGALVLELSGVEKVLKAYCKEEVIAYCPLDSTQIIKKMCTWLGSV